MQSHRCAVFVLLVPAFTHEGSRARPDRFPDLAADQHEALVQKVRDRLRSALPDLAALPWFAAGAHPEVEVAAASITTRGEIGQGAYGYVYVPLAPGPWPL